MDAEKMSVLKCYEEGEFKGSVEVPEKYMGNLNIGRLFYHKDLYKGDVKIKNIKRKSDVTEITVEPVKYSKI